VGPVRSPLLPALLLLALPLAAALTPGAVAALCDRTSTGLPALDDLGSGLYQGAQGGLYPGGSNERPAAWTHVGESLARLAVPRSAQGLPDPVQGRSVFLSIGMSNTRSEFQQFLPLAQADPQRHAQVRVVNGAIGGQDAVRINDPQAPYWAQVDQILAQQGLTPLQVQAVWLKQAIAGPQGQPLAHAEVLRDELQGIVQILKARFPNLWVVYLSSRIYAGYASTGLNPEPYAHASGWSVKWLVESQIQGTFPLQAPDQGVVGPWLSWGPYLWADGMSPRSDGLTWACSEFANDGTHPNALGGRKVANLLLDWVHGDPTARTWYTHAGLPPAAVPLAP
jgi:hypothetical protein